MLVLCQKTCLDGVLLRPQRELATASQAAVEQAAATLSERVAAAETAAVAARGDCRRLEAELAALRKQKAWTPKATEARLQSLQPLNPTP
jgi:hypothetical protein